MSVNATAPAAAGVPAAEGAVLALGVEALVLVAAGDAFGAESEGTALAAAAGGVVAAAASASVVGAEVAVSDVVDVVLDDVGLEQPAITTQARTTAAIRTACIAAVSGTVGALSSANGFVPMTRRQRPPEIALRGPFDFIFALGEDYIMS